MNAPLDTAIAVDVYRQRRERVLSALRAAGGGVAIVPTAPEMLRNRDTAYPYRHDSYFYYLTGFTEPDAVLVLNAAGRRAARNPSCSAARRTPTAKPGKASITGPTPRATRSASMRLMRST